jgi:DUF4097 and DUF4098 domain-containing protein YvlB
MLLMAIKVSAQVHIEKISKELKFEKQGTANALMVANINGSVIVQGYTGDRILVEVTKTIKAKTETRLQKGKDEIAVGVIDRADTIILFVDGVCNKFGRNGEQGKRNRSRYNWGYDWNDCNRGKDWREREGYDYSLDFTIKVPQGVSVLLSTINGGDITVENVAGAVSADNINGSIKMKNLAGKTFASTINGDVDLEYDKNPDQDCRYYTLNGDINALFQKGLAADLGFESFNGSFYTNVETLEHVPVTLEKKNTNGGIRFKVNGSRFKVGKGGAYLDFETFNGDVYLKEK